MECDAFEDQHDPALHSAIAVLVPWPIGKTAARPKKSKDCWKCGGDGLLVPETPYPGCLVIHRPEGLVIEEMLAKVPKGPKKKRDRKAD
jgi:hypothetical protein